MSETARIIIGYIVFTVYTCSIMYAGVLLEKKTNINKTVCRKLTHVVSAFVWVICYFFFGCSIHWVLLNGIGAVALGFVTFGAKFQAFEREDAKSSLGLFYFGLSTFVTALICYLVGPELYLYTGIAYYCLALGDGLAPICAMLAKKNVQIMPHKTLVGSLSVYMISFLSTLVFSWIFGMQLDVLFMLSIAALTCVAEFYGLKGTDNLLIEFLVFGYLVMHHYGLVGLQLELVLCISPLLAFAAVGLGAMTPGAGFFAFGLFALTGFFGQGFLPVVFIAVLFGISTVVNVLGKRLGKKTGSKADHAPRKARQIVAVGLAALVFLGIHYFTGIKLFYYLFFLSLTEQFADSMASDIGSLIGKKNFNIMTRHPMEKGLSGGVSLQGTFCALLASFVLMLLPLVCGAVSWQAYVIVSLLAFLGTVVDSVAGAVLQALYECPVCKCKVEHRLHCGEKAHLIKGFDHIDNTAVNYIANLVTCAAGCVLLLI